MFKRFYFLLAVVLLPLLSSGQLFSVSGSVTDPIGKTLSNVTIELLDEQRVQILSDENGYFEFQNLAAGTYQLKFSHVSYKPVSRHIKLDKDLQIQIAFKDNLINIDQVYVNARESRRIGTSSIIDRQAMQHLQPSSFSDILELLPGGRTQSPDLAGVNAINLRSPTSSSTYATHSLGTMFTIDGMTLNSQSMIDPVQGFGLNAGSMHAGRSVSNIGIDMRGINTDNIESIEIIRGIPSVEYGNLTSGAVLIERIKGYEPWSARIKADGFSKLFSLGKGYALKNYNLNFDANYLLSNQDVTDVFNNFKRINTSIRGERTWVTQQYRFLWSHQLAYNTTLDDERLDPDNDFKGIDSYKNSKRFFSLNNNFKFYNSNVNSRFRNATLSVSANYNKNELDVTKLVQASSGSILMNSLTPGSHQADFTVPTYTGNMRVDDRPLDLRMKLISNWRIKAGIGHQLKIGAEYNYAKNLGSGQNYDLDRPISSNISARPRDFSQIPAMSTISLFAEDQFFIKIGSLLFENSVGLRSYVLGNLDSKYDISGKVFLEPRYNARLHLGKMTLWGKDLKANITGGFGLQVLNPTQNYLYPNAHYQDRAELSYYHNTPDYRLAWANTVITDPTNYQILPAKNKKWELGIHLDRDGSSFSVTYFKEQMNDGFRNSDIFNSIAFRKYDVNSVDPAGITTRPSIADFDYEDQAEYHSFSQFRNGSTMDKQGVEYQFSSKRIPGINTRFTVGGAWFKSFTRNSEPVFSTLNTTVTDGKLRQFLAVYADQSTGGENQSLNTNLLVDSYLPKLGLNISVGLQSLWFNSNQRLYRTDLPIGYYTIDGRYFSYQEADRYDPNLRHFDLKLDPALFRKHTQPIDLLMNIKATKNIKDKIKVAMFVNRLFVYKPNYVLYGYKYYRNNEAQDAPYFGMEINIRI